MGNANNFKEILKTWCKKRVSCLPLAKIKWKKSELVKWLLFLIECVNYLILKDFTEKKSWSHLLQKKLRIIVYFFLSLEFCGHLFFLYMFFMLSLVKKVLFISVASSQNFTKLFIPKMRTDLIRTSVIWLERNFSI